MRELPVLAQRGRSTDSSSPCDFPDRTCHAEAAPAAKAGGSKRHSDVPNWDFRTYRVHLQPVATIALTRGVPFLRRTPIRRN
jgi:hypothetical protein